MNVKRKMRHLKQSKHATQKCVELMRCHARTETSFKRLGDDQMNNSCAIYCEYQLCSKGKTAHSFAIPGSQPVPWDGEEGRGREVTRVPAREALSRIEVRTRRARSAVGKLMPVIRCTWYDYKGLETPPSIALKHQV